MKRHSYVLPADHPINDAVAELHSGLNAIQPIGLVFGAPGSGTPDVLDHLEYRIGALDPNRSPLRIFCGLGWSSRSLEKGIREALKRDGHLAHNDVKLDKLTIIELLQVHRVSDLLCDNVHKLNPSALDLLVELPSLCARAGIELRIVASTEKSPGDLEIKVTGLIHRYVGPVILGPMCSMEIGETLAASVTAFRDQVATAWNSPKTTSGKKAGCRLRAIQKAVRGNRTALAAFGRRYNEEFGSSVPTAQRIIQIGKKLQAGVAFDYATNQLEFPEARDWAAKAYHAATV